ncbi:von Willebrand factor [Sinocyclocheilus rhinocerous]|uniref:von Willebrand factor n=1 Tax=Sinocyclocheilus rhinocerous TaxID=307959 RepID=UPI0007B79CDB|nr:PREDICTED: von Willebrand factor [Sinocyclocheilus rhinocerous]
MEQCRWKGWSRILWVFVLNFPGLVSVEGSGRCSLFSRQHIHTFDGVIYEFPGDCSYMLAGDCQHRSFSILGDFSHGKRKGVTLFLGEFFELHLSVDGTLSQGAERLPLPYASSSVFAGYELGYVRLWSEEFGFSIRIDPSHNIQLMLAKQHSNRTCGLCGNYNYLVEDEYTAQEGFLTDDPYDFANSWAMKGADEPCKRILPPSQSCNSTGESAKDQMSRCEAMSSSTLYLRCAHLMDAAAFVSVCESDACHCSTGDDCVCQAMLEYARTCANRGITLSNWHVQNQCSPKCPIGMEYSDCTPTCSTSCQNINIQEVCKEECVDGCNCPAGKVLDGDHCVDVSQCSCMHAGRRYPPASSISQDCNTCVCRHGSWECTNEECPGECLVTGQSHYKTFDNKFFTFSGICQYLLAKDCQSNSFSVIIETAQCADDQDAVCTRSITLRFHDLPKQTVRLKHGGVVSVDGMDVKTPLINGALRVQNTVLSSVRLHYGDDLHLDWDGRGRVLLRLNPAYAGKTCGLCGNYNGNQGDDFLTVGGLVETRVEGFGNAWKMNADCDNVQLQPSDPCILNPKRVRFAEEACAVLLSVKFVPCHYVVNPEPYVKNCRYDVCSCADGQVCLCDAVRSYAAACAAKGVLINWRGHGYCELTCPDDQVYEVCGSVCNQTCRSLSLPDGDCGGFCEEGCFCPRGLFLSDAGECVPPEHCSCHHNGEIFEPNDMIGDHHSIWECNSVVDPEPYWDICTHDTCSCLSVGDCACFCNTIAAYAHECAQKGLVVNWRSNDLCPLSCEELNKDAGVECEWRYNACGSACPPTCQHPEPLSCPITCVEGCHAVCPPGQVLDEVLRKCVEASQCQVCMHDGERISHGKQFILNHDDPHLCQICHCESTTLTCGPCPVTGFASTLTPTTVSNTPTPLPFSTPVPADACDRAMDLAFLVDGSSALSEEDFGLVKLFILRVVERFRMGSAHTRATVLLFHSGVKSYDMQVQKWIFKKMVRDLRYSGGDVAFMDEAIKYLAVYIYDKNKREHAGRVAILLTASANPRPMRSTQRLLRKKDITILTVALGPDVNMAQVNEITKATPSSRSYVVSSVSELDDEALAITDYLCTLGLDPEPPKKPSTTKPSTTSVTPTTTATSKLTAATIPPTAAIVNTFPSIPSPGTTFPPPTVTTYEVVFLLESSDAVGEEGFNKTRDALVDVVASLDQKEVENLRITVVQYSFTVTVVISRMELQHREQVLQRMRQLRWTKGAEVNTGHAIRSVYETVTTDTPSNMPDQMVFLITQSPPTDVIQRPPSSAHKKVYPIGIGQQIRYEDLVQLSFPDEPIMLDNPSDLKILRPMLINISKTIRRPVLPTLPPRATLPPSVPCSKPMDVLFLLRASSDNQFEDFKTFVRTFIKGTNIGRNDTQVAVIVYGAKSTVAVTWRDEQTEDNLLKLLETLHSKTDNTPRLGAALRLAVQTAISSTSGGRMGIPKAVVMVVTDRSIDSVQEAANEALTAGVSVFPIGLGNQYDQTELSTLAGWHAQDNIIRLSSTEYLLAMAALDQSFTDKLCRAGPPGVCVDDEGNERKPGETWLLPDGCHSVLCNPSGTVTVQSHRINCEKMEPPVCKNNLPALRYNHTCGCTWTCPCSCMGSSTSHVVSFSGAALKLRAACSYLLLRSGGVELVLHTAACQSSPNQICMKSLELRKGGTSVVLRDDMKVTVGGVITAVPFRSEGVTVTQIGAILHQLRSEQHGFTLTFTPHSNEFMVNMDITMKPNTTGLCGSCSDDQTGLVLSDGSVTTDPDMYLKGWALGECVQHQEVQSCAAGVVKGCDVLSSEVFSHCHALVPPQDYVQICRTVACQPNAVCDLVTAYSSVCRQQGVCVDWRTPTLCPMSCSDSMEYAACRTGCLEQCGRSQFSPGDMMGDGLMKGNGSVCLKTPTEGCFCPEGSVLMGDKCVSKETCSQCVDHHGKTHKFMESWNPEENPCLLCVCLDQQRINCTALPCTNSKAPECGQCEVLREKTGSKCCPEYECVCDPNCKRSDPPHCDHGLSVVLTNPGDCLPVYQCVCKKDQCPVTTKPSCPAYKKLSVTPSECCDSYECVCDCQNITRTCPPGYIMKTTANDCNCIEVTCTPDKVCVVDTVVYQVGSRWDEKCKTCTCTEQADRQTGLHIAQCVDPVCNQICPLGTTYSHSEDECCGHCRKSSCVEGGHLRQVGEQWVSPQDRCVWSECVQVNEEVFIQHTNVSCHLMDTPTCPLGTELQCNTVEDCCPTCHCVPMDVCVLNQTVIAAGERVMVDVCTHCECVKDKRSYRLSCRKMSCSPCSEGYTLEPIPNACCGRCVATECSIRRPDRQLVTLKANTTRTDGCTKHTCSVNKDEELVLETLVTTCPPFDRKRCLEHGGKISQIGDTCCEMCTEPECRRTVGLLNYIRVDDCQSEEKIELTYCEGKCGSKSMYSLDKHKVESECVCCSATGTVPMNVPLRCANGTQTHHQVLAVTGCDCMSHACSTD